MKALDADLLRAFPLPDVEGDKEARGRVMVFAGGAQTPGAARLCGEAALRAGAGKLQLVATEAFAQSLGMEIPEARVFTLAATRSGEVQADALPDLAGFIARCSAVVLGPGMVDEENAGALARGLAGLDFAGAAVIDAGALTGLSDAAALAPLAGRLVLTPHEGEMAALLGVPGGEVEADPAAAARRAAAQWSATVALKGRDTYVASPDGLVWRHEGPVPGLGVSGSGDVLAGVIGGLLAQGAPPATATLWGVWLHAMAGRTLAEDVGPSGYLARELAARIPGLRRQAAP